MALVSAADLLAAHRSAGLRVEEWPGWQTNGGSWAKGKPEGVMEHHTAPPVPFPVGRLAGEDQGRVKCNINTKPDGTIWMVAYEACNYSSGSGSSVVLRENVRKSVAPTANAKQRGLSDDMGGNRYFWNYENDHLGDGSPIPQVQLDAIIESTKIVVAHFGLNAEQVISHAEWTERKIDPRWNGSNRTAIEEIRAGVRQEAEVERPAFLTDIELGDESPAVEWIQTFLCQLEGIDTQNQSMRTAAAEAGMTVRVFDDVMAALVKKHEPLGTGVRLSTGETHRLMMKAQQHVHKIAGITTGKEVR